MNRLVKRNDFEIRQYRNALLARTDTIKGLYRDIKAGILTLTDIQEQVDMTKKQVLDLHRKMFNYWQGKNGKWYSYLPKEGVEPPKGRQIESVSEEKLDNKIVDYYVREEKAKKEREKNCPTFLDVYFMWRAVKDLELDDNSVIITDNPVEFLEPKDFIRRCVEREKPDSERYYTAEEIGIIMKGLRG